MRRITIAPAVLLLSWLLTPATVSAETYEFTYTPKAYAWEKFFSIPAGIGQPPIPDDLTFTFNNNTADNWKDFHIYSINPQGATMNNWENMNLGNVVSKQFNRIGVDNNIFPAYEPWGGEMASVLSLAGGPIAPGEKVDVSFSLQHKYSVDFWAIPTLDGGLDAPFFNPNVPEIDPAGLGSVMGLVLGACGLMERRLRGTRAPGAAARG
jgi:hypothetical protein